VTIQGASQLGLDDLVGAAGFALREGLSHAEDGRETPLESPSELAAEGGIGFAEAVPSL
jgi:hypothetical protein